MSVQHASPTAPPEKCRYSVTITLDTEAPPGHPEIAAGAALHRLLHTPWQLPVSVHAYPLPAELRWIVHLVATGHVVGVFPDTD
jgi:hypothetical protein